MSFVGKIFPRRFRHKIIFSRLFSFLTNIGQGLNVQKRVHIVVLQQPVELVQVRDSIQYVHIVPYPIMVGSKAIPRNVKKTVHFYSLAHFPTTTRQNRFNVLSKKDHFNS
jgi:hypothetical protein